MLEHFKQDLISFEAFARRVLLYAVVATVLLILSIAPGIAGYRWIAGLSYKQAFVNSISVLGAVDPPYPLPDSDTAGLLFVAIYGLFTETVFLLSLGILVAPTVHRIFHRLHINTHRGDDGV